MVHIKFNLVMTKAYQILPCQTNLIFFRDQGPRLFQDGAPNPNWSPVPRCLAAARERLRQRLLQLCHLHLEDAPQRIIVLLMQLTLTAVQLHSDAA